MCQELSIWEHGKQAFCPLQEHLLGLWGLNLAQPENRLPFTFHKGESEFISNMPPPKFRWVCQKAFVIPVEAEAGGSLGLVG